MTAPIPEGCVYCEMPGGQHEERCCCHPVYGEPIFRRPQRVDLDALAAALAKRSPGQWDTSGAGERGEIAVRGPDDEMLAQGMSMDHAADDVAAIVAVMNASETLVELAKAVVRWRETILEGAETKSARWARDEAIDALLTLAAGFVSKEPR